jgi:hypothetical protein
MTFQRVLFLVANLPVLINILKDFWAVLTHEPDKETKDFLLNVMSTMRDVRNAKTEIEKDDATRDLALLISKLR